jgi:hypothetical protein
MTTTFCELSCPTVLPEPTRVTVSVVAVRCTTT